MSDFSKRLRELREGKRLQQNDAARKLGLTPQTLSKYENDLREPDIETIKNIAKFYEVSVDYLVGYEDKSYLNKIVLQDYIKELENNILSIKKYVNNSK